MRSFRVRRARCRPAPAGPADRGVVVTSVLRLCRRAGTHNHSADRLRSRSRRWSAGKRLRASATTSPVQRRVNRLDEYHGTEGYTRVHPARSRDGDRRLAEPLRPRLEVRPHHTSGSDALFSRRRCVPRPSLPPHGQGVEPRPRKPSSPKRLSTCGWCGSVLHQSPTTRRRRPCESHSLLGSVGLSPPSSSPSPSSSSTSSASASSSIRRR